MKIKLEQYILGLKDFFLGKIPDNYKEEYLKIKQKTNLNQAIALSVFIILTQVSLNIINIFKQNATPSNSNNVEKYIILSLIALTIGIICLALIVAGRKKKSTKGFYTVLPYILLYSYVLIQIAFVYLNLENNTWIGSYMIALLIVNFGIFKSPIHNSISVFTICILTVSMMFITRHENDIWNMILENDTWAILIIITIFCDVMSNVMYHMYLSNVINSIKMKKVNNQLAVTARTDALTGLNNRYGFYEFLDNNYFYKKNNYFIAAAMMDVDLFKKYNDTYGHMEGDICLQNIAKVLEGCFEHVDGVLCRYGGEEFLSLFYVDSKEKAFEIVDSCREKVSIKHLDISEGLAVPVTISAGIACFPTCGEFSIDVLISLADTALYQAKINGRNNTVFADENEGVCYTKNKHVNKSKEEENS